MVAIEEVPSDEEELTEEQLEERAAEKRRRDGEYLQFRRAFDQLKKDHKAQQAESDKLKEQGNNFFKLGLYMQASMMYSEALELQPDNAVLYCNRAMAYLKQEMVPEALADAEKSLEIDGSVENIKAYWRKSQALLDLGHLEESEAVADEGLALQAGNQHLNRVRRKARELSTMKKLCYCPWSATMANGVEKTYTFQKDGSMSITVFGHSINATYDLSVEGNPRSMVVKMKPEGLGAGTGPPPPPRPYIFEFHDNDSELWLCTPMESDELPTKFEGPGFDRLRKATEEAAPDEDDATEPLDVRASRYIREVVDSMPLLPAQLPESPSDQQINQEVLIMEKISKLRRRYGVKVHQRALELAKNPESAKTTELRDLAAALQMRFVARRIITPPEEVAEAKKEEKPVEKSAPAPTSQDATKQAVDAPARPAKTRPWW
eukprot:CAMPEP_0206450668 /NCGR_PEP_ID=MMETSP0324_2-20121206/18870_1 /ASSEMBLY_ACC=CAM_ASM_000836 /TAXON_ID=2866 /ORGANISM="Crypthecodinium cohnii, Strain Seligo" /LENGTH=433 /DNA_ID=CAMNT_0053920377 /DNA_START=113 /DNA_END=1411 /DNA_ORIENTATION=-